MEAAAELGELRLHVPADIVVHVSPSHGDLQSHGALLRVLVHTLSHRPGEANDLDPPGARSPKLGCARRHRRPGRVDVIDEGNVARRLDAAHEGAPHVCGALAPGQPGLSRGRPGTGEERCDRQLPQGGEHPREPLRRDMATRPSALPVAGHERDRARVGSSDHLRDHRAERGREVPPPALLPRGDEQASACVVDERAPGSGEGQAPAGAFDAAPYGPCARAAAPLTDGRPDPDQARVTALAERRPGCRAQGAAGREHEAEQAHPPTVRRHPSRLRTVLVPVLELVVTPRDDEGARDHGSSTRRPSSSRSPGRERSRSSGSLIGKNRPPGPERGTSRKVVSSSHETWW